MVYKEVNRSHKHRRVLLPIAIVILVLIGAGVGYYYHSMKPVSNTESKKQTSYNAPNIARKASNNPSTTLDNGSTTPAKTSSPATFTVQIVSSNVDDNNTNLHIGTMVNNLSEGNCMLTASQTGQATLQLGTSLVRQDVNYYDCGVFNIPTSKFPISGTWNLKLTVTNDGSEASTSSTTVIPGS
jgi:hypothetical protein